MSTILKYAEDKATERIISIYDVIRGLKCNCICPECKAALVAKQGSNNEWHFAHHNSIECAGALETMLHKMAKQILKENNKKNILLPGNKVFEYQSTNLEKIINNYRIDIVLVNDTAELLVEIVVTNEIRSQKERYILINNLTALEIDLSDVDRNIEYSELEKIVVYQTDRKRMIMVASIEPAPSFFENPRTYMWIAVIVGFVIWVRKSFRKKYAK